MFCLYRITILFSFILIFFNASAQDLNVLGKLEDFSDAPTYYNLKKAKRHKEEVRILDLSNQKLDEFPLGILELKNLVVLRIDSNQIDVIPDEIENLKE